MNGRVMGWLRVHLQKIRQLHFVIACVANWLVVDLYFVPDFAEGVAIDRNTRVEPRGGRLTMSFWLITLLAIAQFFCAGLLFIFHLVLKTPQRVQELWSNKNVGSSSMLFRMALQATQMDRQIATSGRVGRIKCRQKPCVWFVYWGVSIWWAATEVELIFLAASIVAATLAIILHHFFLAFHLLGLVQVSSKLQSVTDAISHVFWTVVVTILLIVLLTYLCE